MRRRKAVLIVTMKTKQIKTEQADDDGWFTIKQSDLIDNMEQQASDFATNTSEWMVDGWMDNMYDQEA